MSQNQQREKLQQLPVRAYLDETVVPVMMQALSAVSRERPEDPVEFVAHYMLQHNPRKVADANRQPGGGGGNTSGRY
jgi:protein dpy-30